MTTRWRTLPPSTKQLNFLRQLGYTGTMPTTRGTASAKIDELLGKRRTTTATTSTQRKCPECGRRRDLVRDNEDGLLKCSDCCDMPSDDWDDDE